MSCYHVTNSYGIILSVRLQYVCFNIILQKEYEPVLSLHASSLPLYGAAPFPRSASSVPSHAVSSAHALAAAAVRRTQAHKESGSQRNELSVFTQIRKSCLSRHSLPSTMGLGLDSFIKKGRNCSTFTQDTNIGLYTCTNTHALVGSHTESQTHTWP